MFQFQAILSMRQKRTDGQTFWPQTSTIHHIFAFTNWNARKTAPFLRFYECVRNLRTDLLTDQRTDKATYRDARKHLKKGRPILSPILSPFFKEGDHVINNLGSCWNDNSYDAFNHRRWNKDWEKMKWIFTRIVLFNSTNGETWPHTWSIDATTAVMRAARPKPQYDSNPND